MASPSGYVYEIKSLRKEIKRLNDHLSVLRSQKRTAEGRLYNYMVKNNLNKYEGITLGSIKPNSEKFPRKRKSDKKRDAIQLFRDTGINDPETFWNQFLETQRYSTEESSNSSSKNDNPRNGGYDEYLGF